MECPHCGGREPIPQYIRDAFPKDFSRKETVSKEMINKLAEQVARMWVYQRKVEEYLDDL